MITPQDIADALNSNGLDTPEKLTAFLKPAAIATQLNVIDGQLAAVNTKQTAANEEFTKAREELIAAKESLRK